MNESGFPLSVRVKICGVTLPGDAELAAALGADMIGLNFYDGSRRYLDPAKAHEVVEAIPAGVWKVGVFVNASRAEIEDRRSGLAWARSIVLIQRVWLSIEPGIA